MQLIDVFRHFGEAANLGLGTNSNVGGDIKLWSVNVTSFAKRWDVMCKWQTDVAMIQEARLGEEAQRIMSVRIAQDNKVPIWGKSMPLKEGKNKTKEGRVNPTIWDAQQGGLACVCNPAIPVQRVEVHD